MLYPVENEYRRLTRLDGVWDFVVDVAGRGVELGWFRAFPKSSQPMAVPASYNDITTDAEVRDHIGAVWYRRSFFVPSSWRDGSVLLRVGAASHHATLWVNGVELCKHQGGFLPFEGDASAAVRFGEDNELVLRVDNRLDWTTLPPGRVVPAGQKRPGYQGNRQRQDYFHDFFNYAGIHRSVYALGLPARRIDGLRTKADFSGTVGRVDYDVRLVGPGHVSVVLCDHEQKQVAQATGRAGSLRVPEVELWRPGRPYLYDLRVTLRDESGKVLDEYRRKVGIRTVQVTATSFLINGEPFVFKGFGKHEDVEIKGKGHDDAVMLRDFALLEWIGANSFRTSHYPYAEEVLDLADRLGVVVIDEVPAVGLNSWNKAEPWFVPDKLSEATLAHHLSSIRELVARDQHHPSVVMWSVANEASTYEPASRPYFQRCIALFRELDDRPLTLPQSSNPDECQVQDLLDVVSLNRYYGWYENVGDLDPDVLQQALAYEVEAWRRRFPGQPFLMAELGSDTLAGLHQLPPAMFSEEYQVELLALSLDCLARYDFVIGAHVWAFADFLTKQGLTRVGGNKKGIFTRNRQPKAAAHFLRERWTARRT
ncbi:MAG TPA: beta-glucuronidase [Polyangiaceae bacterium]|nr:beta-glucuronidase [Polyangiaceae bacterium]